MSAPRLHVIPALACEKALVLRRGPSRRVASLLWDRATGEVTLGQWLKGRIYEHRSDLSPDGRHMIVFAGTGQKWWTAISRAPWLRAIHIIPTDHTWHGGGAFDGAGGVILNDIPTPEALPGGLRRAPDGALPPASDGVHQGGLCAARMALRGWRDAGGEGYTQAMDKDAGHGWTLRQGFTLGARGRGLLSNTYALHGATGRIETDWEWAEPWRGGLQIARAGALWSVPLGEDGPGDASIIHDFTPMTFEAIAAPYDGQRI